jgi:hypothetical protein
MACRCEQPGCALTARAVTNHPHYCNVCGQPHYTSKDATECDQLEAGS